MSHFTTTILNIMRSACVVLPLISSPVIAQTEGAVGKPPDCKIGEPVPEYGWYPIPGAPDGVELRWCVSKRRLDDGTLYHRPEIRNRTPAWLGICMEYVFTTLKHEKKIVKLSYSVESSGWARPGSPFVAVPSSNYANPDGEIGFRALKVSSDPGGCP